ncbi:hypothetical protein PAESOLCIP111_00227 [Paenibacillus solanacearum]|uniref:Peptidase S9 prolyl oligopeptidase catalytic domain-containing protein n=1 Tax=Paenibacillus solanacearum TaxID=2048548 RepID=A0A916JRY0_9BACL|nr:prolyl oligopeptidase family serine peptidase [Paenibacillus solanacearum]CAG7598455.1 hypothetical protein PAESOLCIP111_00227 [Paenibacillus solanacearum]
MYEAYEDETRLEKTSLRSFQSPYQDFCRYTSSVTPGIQLGLNVIKPEKPGPMLVQLHGWHMSMPNPVRREHPGELPYVVVQVDMRGRAFSEGEPDCNGCELIDMYDAVRFVQQEYAEYLLPVEPAIYLEGGSGGGGNVLAAVAKFPDLFSAATALYGISDYAAWYAQDEAGEFRDEMDVWIGCSPEANAERYEARSGLRLAANVRTPLYMAHGDGDIRVPVSHSRAYVREMERLGRRAGVRYDELPGVGARGHLTGVSEEQQRLLEEGSERNRQDHAQAPRLEAAGTLLVGGFLYTKHFHIHLDSVHSLATAHYDLHSRRITMYAARPVPYRITWMDGSEERGICNSY